LSSDCSDEDALAQARKYCESNVVVPFAPNARQTESIGSMLEDLVKSEVLQGKKVWLHALAGQRTNVVQGIENMSVKDMGIANMPALNVVTQWLTPENYELLFNLGPVAVVSGDSSLEACISHGTFPMFYPPEHKLHAWHSYSFVKGADLYSECLENNSESTMEGVRNRNPNPFRFGSLKVSHALKEEFDTLVQPHYIDRSFWHSFDLGVLAYAQAGSLQAKGHPDLFGKSRQLNWCRLISAQTHEGHPTALDDPRFIPWACIHLDQKELTLIATTFPSHPNVTRFAESIKNCKTVVAEMKGCQTSLTQVAPGLNTLEILDARSRPLQTASSPYQEGPISKTMRQKPPITRTPHFDRSIYAVRQKTVKREPLANMVAPPPSGQAQ
jgi:hypothetical protein